MKLYPALLLLACGFCFLSAPVRADEDSPKASKSAKTAKKGKKSKKKEDKEEAEVSLLAKHPLPKYTDFSTLNSNTRKKEILYRVREFRAYLPVGEMSKRLKIASYSTFENPTGIAFEKGDDISIRMDGTPRSKVEFIVRDFRHPGAETRYPLEPGTNSFTAEHFGHGYVNYRDDDPATAPAIKVRIEGGRINGVFTQHDDVKVWKNMLDNAKSEFLDIMGERCQWVLDLNALRTRCAERGPDLVALYDRQQKIEQQLLGWEWEGIHPGNHIMGRSMWDTSRYMHADGLGGAYVITETPGLVDVDNVSASGAWGTAHEFGHVNQTRPGMMWAGTQETTVNLFAMCVNYDFNPTETRLEHEEGQTMEGMHVRGARFDWYVNSALVNRELWQFHRGPDDGNRAPGERCGDCFVILCPMWQMYLYNTAARGNELFYPRIFKSVRDTDESQWGTGKIRMAYLDRCCDAAELDFSDYFLQTGMLAVMNRYVNDYSSRWVTITEDMCRQSLKHASQYPKPDSPVIFYITTNSVGIYRDKLAVKPSPDFKPELKETPVQHFTVPADKWENAVAFEVYDADNKLIRICLRGLNQKDNASTDVILPKGAAKVMAVSWNGKRYIMYSTGGDTIDATADASTGPGFVTEPASAKKKKKKAKN